MTPADLFRSAVEAIIGPRVDYCALYKGTMAYQHDDGTVDVIPDDQKIRAMGLSNLQIRHGLPGFTVKVPKGTRILVGFTAADPKQPFAALWEAGDAIEVKFGPGGSDAPVARVGDQIMVFMASGVPIPITGTMQLAPLPAPPVTFIATFTAATPFIGVIQGPGNPRLLA